MMNEELQNLFVVQGSQLVEASALRRQSRGGGESRGYIGSIHRDWVLEPNHFTLPLTPLNTSANSQTFCEAWTA